MKTVVIWTLLGALAGIAAASVVMPATLAWYNEVSYGAPGAPVAPGQPAATQSLVNVPSLIRYTTARLIRAQVVGGSLGAVAFLVLGVLVVRRGRPRPVAASPSSRPPASV